MFRRFLCHSPAVNNPFCTRRAVPFLRFMGSASTMNPPAEREDFLYPRTVAKLYYVLYDKEGSVLSSPLSHSRAPLPERKTALIEEGREFARLATAEGNKESQGHTAFINWLESFLFQEVRSERCLKSPSRKKRLEAQQWERKYAPIRPSPTEVATLLDMACQLVTDRKVSLVVASRLMRTMWPQALLDSPSKVHLDFLIDSLCAWTAVSLKENALTPQEARIVLDNMSFRLKNANGRQLVGPLVEVSIRDLDELDNPNVIVSLMHSIHVCGTHAPNSVWGSLFHRLVKLNDTRTSLSSTGGLEHKGESEKAEKPLSKRALKRKQGEQVGHVFSGLTTREIFRTVDVLRQERWNGGGLPMQTLIDAALKNIAFELDALKADEDTADLSYRGVLDRLSLVADLKWRELLSLLSVAGDVDIPFDSTTDKIVDRLLLPMVKHLHGADLLELLRVIRRLKCNAPSLITILSQKLRYEGPHAQYALPLTLSVVKTLVKSNTLITQVEAEPILHYYFAICQLYHNKVRVKGLLEMAEMTYAISRHSTLPSEIYQKCQSVTELLCTQMELLLQLEVVDTEAASKLLEYTIVLNMRDEKKFPCTANLLTCRNVALERSAKQEEETEEGNTSETHFPRVPKAAVDVCNELAYINERIVIVRADMVEDERIRFYHTVSNAGLFSLFLGLKLFQHGYLHDTERNLPLEAELNALLQRMSAYASSPSSVPRLYTMQSFPNTIPSWAEQTLWRIVQHTLRDFRISSSSSDEDVLRCFGDLKCDERKVEQFFHNMMTGPMLFIKSRKELWDFNAELARRFGDAKSVETANTRSKTSLY